MFKKVGLITVIVGLVLISYLILTAAMPAITDMADVAVASANYTNYPGSEEALTSAPFWLYFIPGIVGVVAIVIVMRQS